MLQSGKFKFEKLMVWQESIDYAERVNALTLKFPNREKFNLASQINRAVDSVSLNIAEGATGQSNPEFKKFLGYSIRSLAEVITCLHKTIRRKYISDEEFNTFYDEGFVLMNKIAALIKSLK